MSAARTARQERGAGAVRVIAGRTLTATWRDAGLRVAGGGLLAVLVGVVVVGATAWRDHGAALAVGTGAMPALVMGLLLLMGPLTRDEATGSTRTLIAAAVQPGQIARGTLLALTPWVALGALAAAALLVASAAGAGAGLAPLLLTTVVLGPLVAWLTLHLVLLVWVRRGTETALVPLWIQLVLVTVVLALVATGIVAPSWVLASGAAVLAACLAVGSWALGSAPR